MKYMVLTINGRLKVIFICCIYYINLPDICCGFWTYLNQMEAQHVRLCVGAFPEGGAVHSCRSAKRPCFRPLRTLPYIPVDRKI